MPRNQRNSTLVGLLVVEKIKNIFIKTIDFRRFSCAFGVVMVHSDQDPLESNGITVIGSLPNFLIVQEHQI